MFFKEYIRPISKHNNIIDLWVISRAMVKIIEELGSKRFCRFKCMIRIIVTITPCYKLNCF